MTRPENMATKRASPTDLDSSALVCEMRNSLEALAVLKNGVPIECLVEDPYNRQLHQAHLVTVLKNMETVGQRTQEVPLIGTVQSEEDLDKVRENNYEAVKIKVIVRQNFLCIEYFIFVMLY
jgi:hypothetical protein